VGKRALVGRALFFPKKIATDRALFTLGKIRSAPPKGAGNNRVPVAGEQFLDQIGRIFHRWPRTQKIFQEEGGCADNAACSIQAVISAVVSCKVGVET
jgi:hypothetical protein